MFLYDGLEFNALMAFGLACGDVFLHGRTFVIKVFSSESMEETYSATNV